MAFAWAAQNLSYCRATHWRAIGTSPRILARVRTYMPISPQVSTSRRIDDLLSAGTVNLQRICGPEGAVTVAAIEAGH